jgi:hypothetical protein
MATGRSIRAVQIIAGAAAAALLGTACGNATGQEIDRTAPVGTVTGKFVRVGGPTGPGGTQPPAVPLPGQINFTDAHHQTYTVDVGKKGTFRTTLATGTYQVVGRSPQVSVQYGNGPTEDAKCPLPHKIKVTRHHTIRIQVFCSVP